MSNVSVPAPQYAKALLDGSSCKSLIRCMVNFYETGAIKMTSPTLSGGKQLHDEWMVWAKKALTDDNWEKMWAEPFEYWSDYK